MANIAHKGGLPNLVSEIGFDLVKYFEGNITGSAHTLTINPPAKRLILRNKSLTDSVYLNVSGNPADTSVGLVPGDNIKIDGQGVFIMDFDSLASVSLITDGPSVTVEGILGWKGAT